MVKMVLDCLVEEKSIALAHIPLDNTALVADQMIVWLQGRFADDSDRLIMKCYQLLPDAKPDLEHVEELVGF